jgi:acetyl-CoA C-acetyltransferase
MPVDARTAVIVGAGQISHHAAGLDDALTPPQLMVEAIRRAAQDAGLDRVPDVDSLRVVSTLSWRVNDPARGVADLLGISARQTALSTNGGNSPQSLVNKTALSIQNGELDVAVLVGAEAWRTRQRARKAGVDLAWAHRDESGPRPDAVIGSELNMSHPAERAMGIFMPVQIYPMFETAIRAQAGETPDEHIEKVSELWSRFSAVAASNPYAWIQDAKTPEEIRTAGPSNRMIGLPYPKYMNSNNDVDQAAAIIMCSVEGARALGVASDRLVFPHAGSDCHEHPFVSNRSTFAHTPAIALGGRKALEAAGVTIDDIAIVDLYSCFPSAVQLGAQSLGLTLDRQLTRTGGLAFAGGPWNNYVMHAIATLVRELRERPGDRALVWANGGYCTKHAFGVYSTDPPAARFVHEHPQDEIDAMPRRDLAEGEDAAGPITIEAYTVLHDREGRPETGQAACLLDDGRRAWGTTTDADLVTAMCSGEWVGRRGVLDAAGALRFD